MLNYGCLSMGIDNNSMMGVTSGYGWWWLPWVVITWHQQLMEGFTSSQPARIINLTMSWPCTEVPRTLLAFLEKEWIKSLGSLGITRVGRLWLAWVKACNSGTYESPSIQIPSLPRFIEPSWNITGICDHQPPSTVSGDQLGDSLWRRTAGHAGMGRSREPLYRIKNTSVKQYAW